MTIQVNCLYLGITLQRNPCDLPLQTKQLNAAEIDINSEMFQNELKSNHVSIL